MTYLVLECSVFGTKDQKKGNIQLCQLFDLDCSGLDRASKNWNTWVKQKSESKNFNILEHISSKHTQVEKKVREANGIPSLQEWPECYLLISSFTITWQMKYTTNKATF